VSPVLALEGVSKRYSSYRGEWHRFATWLGLAIRPEREFWALRDVNLTLGAGRSLGIIGENGAGKSSLLKIVAGTTVPTEGSVLLRGAASAVLELGLNFDPELHATENVRLFGHLQGMSPAEVRELEPSIRAFADIGDAFDEPMRTYSTGMYARVAFAAATARRPEILVVDEVLSVGDDPPQPAPDSTGPARPPVPKPQARNPPADHSPFRRVANRAEDLTSGISFAQAGKEVVPTRRIGFSP